MLPVLDSGVYAGLTSAWQDLLPAASVRVDECERPGRADLARVAEAARRQPDEIDVARLVEELEDVRALARENADT